MLPTPQAHDAQKGKAAEQVAAMRAKGHGVVNLNEVAENALLPTPVAQPSGNTPEDHLRKKPGREVVTDLAIIVENGLIETGGRLMPTPKASDGEKGGPNQRGSKGDLALPSAAVQTATNWGPYEPAIRRWERIFGHPAPAPTELSVKGTHRLSARFAEWMMGIPAGWVTDVPGISRNNMLKAIGNGVCTQQAEAALTDMLAAFEAQERGAA